MKYLLRYKFFIFLLLVPVVCLTLWVLYPAEKVDFSTEVKPVLNKHCIACHGGVKKNGGFSLLFQEEALGINESGRSAIVPGHADESELMRRILSDDPELRMPYKKDPLSKEEIDILKRWIDQGAVWGEHWAYKPVKKPKLPGKKAMAAVGVEGAGHGNEVDLFIGKELSRAGLSPSTEATAEVLLRRVSLDLTGLPPSDGLVEAHLKAGSPITYEQAVDSLLASPAYGERWAAMWMDLARYADTKGYEKDLSRQIWRYRDWLIRAFNADKPYNEFLTEQLAGDLLPNPTDAQLIATAFHRNTMTNDEGGTDNEEFRVAAVLDRVNTTWETLMGTTFACVQCHSHPYDPIRHEEYYKFAAFFDNTRDEDTFEEYPLLKHFAPEDSLRLATLKTWLREHTAPDREKEMVQFAKTWQPVHYSIRTDEFVNSDLADTKWLALRNHGVARLPHVELTGKERLTFRYRTGQNNGTWTIRVDHPQKGGLLARMKMKNTSNAWAIETIALPKHQGVHHLYFSYENPELKDPNTNGLVFDWFYFAEAFPKGEGAKEAEEAYYALVKASTGTTPIMLENPDFMRRTTHVFERGNWLVKGDEVKPGVPLVFPAMPEGAPANRLGLALWMTDPAHPLTARTIVNRIWEQVFGQGLAETLEDMGSQGIEPVHPELLDYLAWQLVHEYKWSLKKLLKTLVMSATYKQTSAATPEMLEKDRFNRYYARAPRIRLSAEQLRDQALAVSGMLSKKRYGPSVMPYQPEGIWNSAYSSERWKLSEGEDAHRRGLYTYWKRTSAYPAMLTFDASAREVCLARRIRTNTPLQALVLLNDSVYVEAAHHLALRMQKEEHPIEFAYEQAMKRPITSQRKEALMALYSEALVAYEGRPEAALHSMQLVAAAILNLDEFVTKN